MRLVGPITGLFVSAGVSAVTSAVMDVWRHSHVKTNVCLADASKQIAEKRFADLCERRQSIIQFRNTVKQKWPIYQDHGEDVYIGSLVEAYLQRLYDIDEHTFLFEDVKGGSYQVLVFQKEEAIKKVFKEYVRFYDIHWDIIPPPHIDHRDLTNVLRHQRDLRTADQCSIY